MISRDPAVIREIEEVCKFCGSTRKVTLRDGHRYGQDGPFYHYGYCHIPSNEVISWCETHELKEYTEE